MGLPFWATLYIKKKHAYTMYRVKIVHYFHSIRVCVLAQCMLQSLDIILRLFSMAHVTCRDPCQHHGQPDNTEKFSDS